jgi:hypothetical protein
VENWIELRGGSPTPNTIEAAVVMDAPSSVIDGGGAENPWQRLQFRPITVDLAANSDAVGGKKEIRSSGGSWWHTAASKRVQTMHKTNKITPSDKLAPDPQPEADLLSPDDDVALLHALSQGNRRAGCKGFTEAEAAKVRQWAHDVRTKSAILDLVLMGLTTITIRALDELIFTAVVDRPDLVAQLRADAEIEPPAA